jgi:hypothetical protein
MGSTVAGILCHTQLTHLPTTRAAVCYVQKNSKTITQLLTPVLPA